MDSQVSVIEDVPEIGDMYCRSCGMKTPNIELRVEECNVNGKQRLRAYSKCPNKHKTDRNTKTFLIKSTNDTSKETNDQNKENENPIEPKEKKPRKPRKNKAIEVDADLMKKYETFMLFNKLMMNN